MKTRSILLSAILMAAITPAFAQATSGTQGMKMDQNMPTHSTRSGTMMNCMPRGKGTQNSSGMQGTQMGKVKPCANRTAQGTGVIEATDAAKGTITIKHQSIASIHWPPMTMTFKADPPNLLKSVKVGEKVNFTLHPAGMNSTVTAIAPIK